MTEAIGEAGMVAPSESLVVGEVAGALGLEVEETNGESLVIVKGMD